MKNGLFALPLIGLLGIGGVGCGSSPCDELADELEAGGCTPEDTESADQECSGDVEKAAQCFLDNVADACAPTAEELTAHSECQGG